MKRGPSLFPNLERERNSANKSIGAPTSSRLNQLFHNYRAFPIFVRIDLEEFLPRIHLCIALGMNHNQPVTTRLASLQIVLFNGADRLVTSFTEL